jgi:hypothetical protein
MSAKIKNYMRKRPRQVNGLKDLIKYIGGSGIIMVEIGSYAGESASIFGKQESVKLINTVDPWENGYDDEDGASTRRPMKSVEAMFNNRMNSQCKGKYKKYKMTGDEAVSKFEDKSLDFVYIDGNHQYEAVKNDIQKWLPKIKDTGHIAGHDWTRDDVKKAVTEELGIPEKIFSDSSWVFKVSNLKNEE